MAHEYIELAALKSARRIDPADTSEDAALQREITAASRRIDDRCGRRFYLDETATARTFTPAGSLLADGTLLIDDIGSTVGLVVEAGQGSSWSTIDSDSYEFLPDNALVQSKPITGIKRLWATWDRSIRVRVTARWGYPTVPDGVVSATLILANKLYLRKDSPEGILRADGIRVSRLDPDVEALIEAHILPGLA